MLEMLVLREKKVGNHSDKEKPHLHLLSTHFYIRVYKTSFVNRPRQLVATVLKLWSIDETACSSSTKLVSSIDLVSW